MVHIKRLIFAALTIALSFGNAGLIADTAAVSNTADSHQLAGASGHTAVHGTKAAGRQSKRAVKKATRSAKRSSRAVNRAAHSNGAHVVEHDAHVVPHDAAHVAAAAAHVAGAPAQDVKAVVHSDPVQKVVKSAAEMAREAKNMLREKVLAGANLFPLNTNVGKPLANDAAKDGKTLQGLMDGDMVTLWSVHHGKYLQVVGGKFLKATGENRLKNKACHFRVVRDKASNWITFQDPATGNNLQCGLNDPRHIARFENKNFANPGHTWERWSLEDGDDASDGVVRLQNQASGAYLTTGHKVFDHYAATKRGENEPATGGHHCYIVIEELPSAAEMAVMQEQEELMREQKAREFAALEAASEIAGLIDTKGQAKRIAVGLGSDHKPLIFVVGTDNGLWKMDTETMEDWRAVSVTIDGKVHAKDFKDVAVSSEDSLVVAVAGDGTVVISEDEGTTWKSLGIPMAGTTAINVDRVAVGDKEMIAVLDKETGDLFIRSGDKWVMQDAKPSVIIGGGMPGMLLGINHSNNDIFRYEKAADGMGNWSRVPNVEGIEYVAIKDEHTMWGTAKDANGHYYLHQFKDGKWMPMLDAKGSPVHGYKHVSVNALGTLVLVNKAGQVFRQGDLSAMYVAPASAVAHVEAVKAATPPAKAEVGAAAHAPAAKAGAKKPATRKATTAKKPAARKATTAKKPAARKTATAKKPAARKATTAKKPVARKTATAKKPAAVHEEAHPAA